MDISDSENQIFTFGSLDLLGSQDNNLLLHNQNILDVQKTQIQRQYIQKLLRFQQRETGNQQNALRSSNTIFKTGTSFFRQILKKFKIKAMNIRISQLLKRKNRSVNMSVFPKLLILAKYYGVLDESRQLFHKNINNLLQKKRGNLRQQRYKALEDNLQKMLMSMDCSSWEQGIRKYWGKTKQKLKLQKSIQEVRKFRQQFYKGEFGDQSLKQIKQQTKQ